MKLINWDCLEEMKKMEDESIDMILTSPPYDNLRTYNWSLNWNFNIFQDIAKECARVIKKWWVIVWVVWDATIKWSETWTSFKQTLYFKELWLNLHDTMIYQKHNFSNPSNNRYHQIFEYMFIFSKWILKTFNPIIDRKNIEAGNIWSWGKNTFTQKDWTKKERTKKINKEYWMRYNIWKFTTSNNKDHPAIFPEKLAEDHILSWSNEWDIVLDIFMWSWTTWKMAKLNNREFIWIEMVEEYFNIAKQRIEWENKQ
jgi:site-specific DNA-methyltransferase (adenine-specific)